MPDDTVDRMLDFALLPDHIQELGERLQAERDAYRAALAEVDAAIAQTVRAFGMMRDSQRLIGQHIRADGRAKRPFTTEGEAWKYIRKAKLKHVRVYQCELCLQWHIATRT